MAELVLRIDATFGSTVEVGDKVSGGEKIGTNQQTGAAVTSVAEGIVKDISFDSEKFLEPIPKPSFLAFSLL